MYQKVTLLGRLTADPALRFTQTGAGVASFTLAVDGDYNSKEQKKETEFLNCVAWNHGNFKLAENIEKYLGKGCIALVEGKIKSRSYEKDGQKKYVTEIIASDVKFVTMKPKAEKAEETLDFSDFGTVIEDMPF